MNVICRLTQMLENIPTLGPQFGHFLEKCFVTFLASYLNKILAPYFDHSSVMT